MTDEGPMTKDVEIMLGSPKKAVIKMAVPITVAIFASSVNGLIDAAWISGLGPNALSAIGLLFPLFFITVGVSAGISVGASAAIARHIGAGSKDNAERTASVAFTLTIVTAITFSAIMLVVTRPLMMLIGGADVIEECMDYANILFIFATAFFINALMSSFLRSEGSARRSMIVMLAGALLNLVLDPIFIYSSDGIFGFGLGLGMTGAALATGVSLLIATIPAFYWFFIKKDTYIRLRTGRPHFDRAITKDIFRVGIPASVEYMAISLAVIIMNMILVTTAFGTEAVAIYSAGWRIFNIIMIPCLGIGAAVVPICAAAYGGRDSMKVKQAFMYSLKISTITMTVLAVLLYLAADIASKIFTYSDDMQHLHGEITQFIRISCIFLPFIGFGIMSSSLFQSLGMGTKALISTAFRNFVIIPVAFLISLSGTLVDIWWGTAFMEIIGPVVVLIWCLLIVRALVRRDAPKPLRT
ncbi:MAG: MATE family efflux transporter [Methanomassiliicoccaceae archaeon]|nr:MATE family efflux transporter [Methanomassiliicoccaceae archaeon]